MKTALVQASILLLLLFIVYQLKFISNNIYDAGAFLVILFQIFIPINIINNKKESLENYNLHAYNLEFLTNIKYKKIIKDFFITIFIAIIIFVPYIFFYLKFNSNFIFSLTIPESWPLEIITQIFVVAMPEEIFYRGFLQNSLKKKYSLINSILITNLFFALSHFVGGFNPLRLLTFFPGLVFSFLSYKTKSVLAPIIFHALCNLLGQILWYSLKP